MGSQHQDVRGYQDCSYLTAPHLSTVNSPHQQQHHYLMMHRNQMHWYHQYLPLQHHPQILPAAAAAMSTQAPYSPVMDVLFSKTQQHNSRSRSQPAAHVTSRRSKGSNRGSGNSGCYRLDCRLGAKQQVAVNQSAPQHQSHARHRKFQTHTLPLHQQAKQHKLCHQLAPQCNKLLV